MVQAAPGPTPDQDPDCAGPHQVQRRRIAGATADDHRHLAFGYVLLEVQRLLPAGDVLGGDHGALDDQDVEAGGECMRVPRPGPAAG